jgi:PKD repeat protein/photosystem II stability/assembly factor-like uncharacterized protein
MKFSVQNTVTLHRSTFLHLLSVIDLINMRTAIHIAFCIGLCIATPSLFAQAPELPYGREADPSLPLWAQFMYEANPDPGKVLEAYRTYYQSVPFVKNEHTQYFKRWMRQLSRDVLGMETGRDPGEWTRLRSETDAYLASSQNNPETLPAWECLGPIDYDHHAIGRSYAPGSAHLYTVQQAPTKPERLYAGTATAGIWRSDNYGEVWYPISHHLPVNSVLALEIDPHNEEVVYTGGGGSVYKSTDGGLSWALTGDAAFQAGYRTANDLLMHPSHPELILLAATDGLFRSANGGESWTKLLGGTFQELEWHPSDPSVVYAVQQSGLKTAFFKSTDAGLTWQQKGQGWPGVVSTQQSPGFNALDFNAANEFVSFNQNPQPGSALLPNFTLELWVKSPGWEEYGAILSNKNWSSGLNPGFVIGGRPDGTWTFNIGNGSSRIDLNGGFIADNLWHHLAISFLSNGQKQLFQDGILVASTNANWNTPGTASSHSLRLAHDGSLTPEHDFRGSIAEVRVWGTALSQLLIQDWLCGSVNSSHSQYLSLVHHWPMSEGSGNSIADAKGSNHGNLEPTVNWLIAQEASCIFYQFNGSDEQKRTEIAVTSADPDRVVALATGKANGGSGLYGIYTSYDAGETWEFTCCGSGPAGPPGSGNPNIMGYNTLGFEAGGQYYYDVALDVSNTNPDSIQAAGIMRWVSGNGGQTWVCPAGWSAPGNPAYIHADIHDIRYFQNGDIWVASDGGLYYSTNNGLSFERRSLGIAGTDFWGFGSGFSDGSVMVGGTYHNSTLIRDGETYINGWISTAIGGAGGDNYRGFVNPYKDRTVYMDAGKRTLPGDRNLPFSNFSFSKLPNASYIVGESSDMAFDPRCFNHIYTGFDNGLWKTEDDGESAFLIHDFGEKVTSIQVTWSNPKVLYVVTYPGWWDTKKLYRSEDSGQTWTNISLPFSQHLWAPLGIAVGTENEQHIWLIRCPQSSNYNNLDGQKVYFSDDGGQTWINLSSPLLNGEYLTNIAYQRGTNGGVYLGTRRAVYYRNLDMDDWVLFNHELPLHTFSTRLIPYYREGKLHNGSNRSVYAVDFFEPGLPQAQIASDRLISYCSRDTLQFFDHSALLDENAERLWQFPGGIPETSAERNPRVHYPLSGSYTVSLTVSDVRGSSTQTLENFITISSDCEPDSIPGYALHLPGGVADYVTAPPLGLQQTNEVTFSAWVRRDGNQHEFAGILFNRLGSEAMGLNIGNNNELRYHWNTSSDWSWNSGHVLPDQQWTHVALVVEPQKVTIYMNGIPSSRTAIHPPKNFFIPFYVGADINFSLRRFKGLIDEVSVWNRALSQDEIRRSMHLCRIPDQDSTLIRYYQFNRPSGEVMDRVGLSHGIPGGALQRVPSTVPVGRGFSEIQNISSPGLYTFSEAAVALDFPASSTLPNGDFLVTRIHWMPDQAPDLYPSTPVYWVFHSFGSNPAPGALQWLDLQQVGPIGSGQLPEGFQLYRRAFNAEGNTWGNSLGGAASTGTGAQGSLQYDASVALSPLGQVVVSVENFLLPVELLSFQAGLNTRRQVELRWQTATEAGTSHFEVQRFRQGQAAEFVCRVEARSPSQSLQHYEALDPAPLSGLSYYRLRIVDFDGSEAYSEWRPILLHNSPGELRLYPNPVASSGNLELFSSHTESMQFELFDASGRRVFTAQVPPGSSSLTLPALPAAWYSYRLISTQYRSQGVLVVE